MFVLFRLSLLLWIIVQFSSAKASTWIDLSRQLTLDTEAVPRSSVIEKLNRFAGLRDKVEAGLDNSETRAYALDIIAAVQDKSFIPLLQQQVVNDPDGYSTLTLNTLLNNKTYGDTAKKYKDLLTNLPELLSPATTMVLIDSLARWGVELDISTVEELLKNDFPEIRETTVEYIRLLILRFHKKQYLKIVPSLVTMKPFQARLKALYLIEELPGGKIKNKLLEPCRLDKNIVVRNKCFQLQKDEKVEK